MAFLLCSGQMQILGGQPCRPCLNRLQAPPLQVLLVIHLSNHGNMAATAQRKKIQNSCLSVTVVVQIVMQTCIPRPSLCPFCIEVCTSNSAKEQRESVQCALIFPGEGLGLQGVSTTSIGTSRQSSPAVGYTHT